MRKKRISAVIVALVVAVGIPSSAFAADIGAAKVTTGEGTAVTNQVNSQAISTNGNNEIVKPDTTTVEQAGSNEENENTIENGNSAEQNKEEAKGESGNLPVVEEPVVEEPAVQDPAVEQPVVETPTVENPVVTEPAIEEPKAEEPVVTEPAIVVEEPVVTEPAIVVEPVVTEPAIVVTEPAIVVTEPAIVVEPAILTINYYGEYDGQSETVTEKVEGYNVGDTVDLTAYINKMVTEYDLLYTGDINEIAIDKVDMDVTLKFTIDLNKRSEEELVNPEGKDAVDYE